MRKNISLISFVGFILWANSGPVESGLIERAHELPNQYEFAGRKASMTYIAPGLNREAMVTYRRGSRELRQFRGDEVRVAETEMGNLVTVTLWSVPDLKTITFSLLIPTVNLDGPDPRLFETKSLVTIHHTTIAGSDLVQGQLQSYLTGNLLAQASHVEGPSNPGSGVFGKVTVSPTCPGPQRPGQICVGPLSETAIQILDENDQIVETAITDEKGLFAIRSEPGEYTIHIDTGGTFPVCPETPVTIPEGLVAVMIRCDTGIR